MFCHVTEYVEHVIRISRIGCMHQLVSTLQLCRYEKFQYPIWYCCCYKILAYKLNERKQKEDLQEEDQHQTQEIRKRHLKVDQKKETIKLMVIKKKVLEVYFWRVKNAKTYV